MREQSLLPCPFCDGEPEEDAGCVSEYYGHEHQNYSISCKSCGAEVYCNVGTFDGADVPCSCHYDTRKVCVDKWNMRPTAAPAVQAEQLSVDTLANVLRNAPDAPSDNQGKKRSEDIIRKLSGNTEQVEPVSDANKLGGWIPVSERMPDDDDFVYIWPRPDFGTELHVGQYCKFHKKGAGWYAQVNEQNYGIEWYPITVTHWMPLPAAPQQEANNG